MCWVLKHQLQAHQCISTSDSGSRFCTGTTIRRLCLVSVRSQPSLSSIQAGWKHSTLRYPCLYTLSRSLFGMRSASANWWKNTEKFLRDIEGPIIFYANVLIWETDQAKHTTRLCTVLWQFEEAELRFQREKCLPSKKSVTLYEEGLQPRIEKVKAV